jgi:hypothetical protein
MADDEVFSLIGTEALMKRQKELDALLQKMERN